MNEEHLNYDLHSILSTNHSVLISHCIASVIRLHTSIQRASQLCIRDEKPTAHLHCEISHHQHERLAALCLMTSGSSKTHFKLASQRAQFRISFLILPFLLLAVWIGVLFCFLSPFQCMMAFGSFWASPIGRTQGTWRFVI